MPAPSPSKQPKDSSADSKERMIESLVRAAGGLSYTYEPAFDRVTWRGDGDSILGLTRNELPSNAGERLQLIHPDDRPVFQAAFEAAAKTSTVFESTYRCLHHDGNYRWLHDRGVFNHDNEGNVCSVIGLLRDTSDERATSEALIAARHELENRREARSDDLRTSEERFRLAVLATSDGIWDLDLVSGIASWNDAFEKKFGPRPEGGGDCLEWWEERIHPEDRGRVRLSLHASIESSEVRWDEKYRFRLADGTYVNVEDRAYIARDRHGKATRILGAMIDVSERRATEIKLADLQDRFESAIAGARDGLWDYDPKTQAVWYSDTFKRLIGLAPHEYDSMEPHLNSFVQLLHPDDKSKTIAAIEAHLEENRPYDVEYRLKMPNGDYHWFRARGQSVRRTDGEVVRMSGSITNIQKQHVTQSRLELAMRAARVGLWDWDVPTGEIYFSDTFYTMLGYEPGDFAMCPEKWQSLVHPDDLGSAESHINAHLNGEEPLYIHEHRLQCKNGAWLWIRDIGELVERNEDGSPKRMIGVHIDINDQVSARLELEKLSSKLKQQTVLARELQARAEAASVAKSEFLANMSHEIRTPMTAILGYTDILLDESDAGSDASNLGALQTIRRNGEHLLGIINDILDLSKIEAGKLMIDRQPCSPFDVLAEIESFMRIRAGERGIDFRIESSEPIPRTIFSDPLRLRQVLINITGNALKFTDRGSVRVVAGLTDDHEPLLSFDVIDSGIGMSMEQVSKLFRPFSQGDSSMARRFGGTGLGLAISRRLTGLLGGEIRIVSTYPQKGTTMRITIDPGPLAGIERAEYTGTRASAGKSTQATTKSAAQLDQDLLLAGKRVLLAEDSIENQRLILQVLEDAGASIEVVENGQSAIEMTESASKNGAGFDLILMDVQMPVVDGCTAIRTLRDRGITLPAIALTGHIAGDEEQRCQSAGFNAYLTKPFKSTHLIDEIRRLTT